MRVDIALKGIGRGTLNGEDLNVVAVHIGGSERVGDTVDRRSANRVGGSVHPSARVILVEVAVAQSDTVNGVGIAETGVRVDVGEANNGLEGVGVSSGASTRTNQEHSIGVDNESTSRAAIDLSVLAHGNIGEIVELAGIGNIICGNIVVHFDSLERAVGLGGEAEQVAVQQLVAVVIGVGVDVRVNIEISAISGHHAASRSAVRDSTGFQNRASILVGHLADVNQSGGAVHIGDIRLRNAGTVRSVADPPDAVDDTVAVGSSDISSTNQVAILVEEPGVVLGGVVSLIEDELDSIVIDSTLDVVLLGVVVDHALSAVNRSGLGNDLAVLVIAGLDDAALSSAVSSVGESVQKNVIADSIRIRILAVGEGQGAGSTGLIIDIHLDGSLGAQVALSVISGRSNIGDLGEEGVDHDDNVIIFSQPNTRRLSRFPVVAAKICKSSNCCRNNRK